MHVVQLDSSSTRDCVAPLILVESAMGKRRNIRLYRDSFEFWHDQLV
jgi:hypothetical protein